MTMKCTHLNTNYGLMVIQHTGPGRGTIVSKFRENSKVEGSAIDVALDALESVVLAHACLDVAMVRDDPNYVEGINTALDAIMNNLGEED
jgi:hypothetical protein